ncbi:MAG: ion transporter, partial [Chitinophagaceae bacterium]
MQKSLRERLYQIIFNADTVAGRRFDVVLLWLILISVLVVLIESIPRLNKEYGDVFFGMELFLTGLFTAEYMVRIAVSPRPL